MSSLTMEEIHEGLLLSFVTIEESSAKSHESQSIGEKDVREVQDRAAARLCLCYLRQSPTQATTRIIFLNVCV